MATGNRRLSLRFLETPEPLTDIAHSSPDRQWQNGWRIFRSEHERHMVGVEDSATSTNTPYVALIGNPNCGKTSIFNVLTGSRYKVANYPGVTVERREGTLHLESREEVSLIDLPGIYSLQGDSPDEKISLQELQKRPDLLILVLDASNLERNLYLASEAIDLGIPLVVALNMIDIAENKGIKILDAKLSMLLDVPVVKLIANKKQGFEQLKTSLAHQLERRELSSKQFAWAKGDSLLIDIARQPQVLESNRSYENVAGARYLWISEIVRLSCFVRGSPSRWAEYFDSIATHRVYGLALFFIIMAMMFQSIYTWASIPMAWIDSGISQLSAWLAPLLPDGQLKSLILDGIIAGVGSVLVFVPQIALLFAFIGILEDSGYLCRAAFVIDSPMRKIGLQGRSFIPLLSSFACAIPGISATRSIPSVSDRLITIMIAPLMSCSARLPIYTVLIAAFLPDYRIHGIISLQGCVMFLLYTLGILGAIFISIILRRSIFHGAPTLFVMEMPPFHLPSFRLIGRDVLDRVIIFIKNAGTIILSCSIILWFLATHPGQDFEGPIDVKSSYAGALGKAIAPAIEPLGLNWEVGIGIIASFAAREVFVSTLATVYSVGNSVSEPETLVMTLKNRREQQNGLTTASALSLLVFYVFACQCMSTLAVCRRETGSWRWPILMFISMTSLAYGSSWITYNLAKMAGL